MFKCLFYNIGIPEMRKRSKNYCIFKISYLNFTLFKMNLNWMISYIMNEKSYIQYV